MEHAQPLPPYLVKRYRGWKATDYERDKAWYRHLAQEGQHPRAMVISCCDSRVHVTAIFGADQGELFIHRNIAAFVPPHEPEGIAPQGTAATIEYAVTALKVAHIVVVGHSSCGGVRGCHDLCAGKAPELEKSSSHVGRWVELLRPGYERVEDIEDEAERIRALEHESVRMSLANLMTFPFVKSAVGNGGLGLHGLWMDIADGRLEQYDIETDSFTAI